MDRIGFGVVHTSVVDPEPGGIRYGRIRIKNIGKFLFVTKISPYESYISS
jgi:hypothetical protein